VSSVYWASLVGSSLQLLQGETVGWGCESGLSKAETQVFMWRRGLFNVEKPGHQTGLNFFFRVFFWHPIGREKNDWLRLVRQNYLDGSHWLPGAKCHSRTQLTLGSGLYQTLALFTGLVRVPELTLA